MENELLARAVFTLQDIQEMRAEVWRKLELVQARGREDTALTRVYRRDLAETIQALERMIELSMGTPHEK